MRIALILVLVLFSSICNANVPDSTGALEKCLVAGGNWTPLLCAAREGDLAATRSLLDSNAEVSTVQRQAALWLASSRGHLEIVELLLRASVEVNSETGRLGGASPPMLWGTTPLIAASANGQRKIVKVLLKAGADVNAAADRNWNRGTTALYEASRTGEREIVELLLDAGADVNRKTDSHRSLALTAAAHGGHREVVEILLKAGADVNAEEDGWTALHSAAVSGRPRIVQTLLQAGAVVDHKTQYADTPLLVAARHGHRKVAQQLLDAGAHVNARDSWGDTALHNAVSAGNFLLAKLLVDKGADVSVTNKYGYTALILAKWHADELAELLKPEGTISQVGLWLQRNWLYLLSVLFVALLGFFVGFAVKSLRRTANDSGVLSSP